MLTAQVTEQLGSRHRPRHYVALQRQCQRTIQFRLRELGLGERLRDGLFLLEAPAAGETTTGVVEVDDGYAVVRLDSVKDGELPEDDVVRNQSYARRIAAATASDEAMGFLQMLRAQSTIEVFEDRLQ